MDTWGGPMELGAYLAILWRRKWVIAVTATVTVTVVVIGTLMATPKYVASTTLRVLTAAGGSADWVDYDIMYTDRLMNTYIKIATSRPVLGELVRRLGLGKPPQIEVEILPDTELFQITVEDPNPIVAREAANALAEILVARSEELYTGKRVRDFVSVIEPAFAPSAPSKPPTKRNIALGFMVGLAGGIGLAFLFENLDTTLYTTEQIKEVAELSTLGKIPTARRQRQVTFFNGNSPQGEAFRRLRTHIFTLDQGMPLQTLLVTSAEPREGKSTIVANLALAIAQSGRKVIVVDGDLRRPTLHRIFDLSNEIGLSSILKQEATLDEAAQDSKIAGVQVLTSGPLPSNPAELLGSPQMTALIEQLAQQFDMVLLDTPSLLAVTDAAVLAPTVDGVVLVVGRAQAQREAVRAAHQQLVYVKARSIGVVVNRAEQDGSYYYYHRAPTQRDE
jgi:succinoglycan biosynthesis transport protein ExoP